MSWWRADRRSKRNQLVVVWDNVVPRRGQGLGRPSEALYTYEKIWVRFLTGPCDILLVSVLNTILVKLADFF